MAVACGFAVGQGQSKTSGTSLAVACAGTLTAGNYLALAFASDSVGITSITRTGTCTLGTWTRIGVADNAGNVLAELWIAPITGTGTITGLTVNHATVTARAAVASQLSGTDGSFSTPRQVIGVDATSEVHDANDPTPSLPGAGLLGAVGHEGPVGDSGAFPVETGSVVTSAGAKLDGMGTSGGGAAANITVHLVFAEYDTTNSTGTVAYQNTTSARDWAAVSAAVYEPSAPAEPTVHPRIVEPVEFVPVHFPNRW